jgi:hypothetical protein
VRTIPGGEELEIDRGKKLGEGRYERIEADEGTIEFWMWPGWDEDDMSFYSSTPSLEPWHDFLRCGELLGRRTHFGARNALAKGVLATNMVLKPGCWYHIAFTWDLDSKDRKRIFTFHVNGASLGRLWSNPPEPGTDWTGPIRLRALTGETKFTGVQISGISCYERLVKGELSPPPDEHTLYSDASSAPADD